LLRKIMAIVAVGALPVLSIGVAQVATSTNAFAAGKTTTCSGGSGQTVTFASPGLSIQGTASASKKSTSTTSASTGGTCTGKHKGTGTVAASKIKSVSKVTCDTDSNPPSPCPSGDFVYDSANQFVSSPGDLAKDLKTTSFTIGSTMYVAANKTSAQAGSGTGAGKCPSGETGFVLTGTLSAPASQKGAATTITACLSTDTGPGTSGNFLNDITAEVLQTAPLTEQIQTAAIDPATSSIVFN
jgi:hypothetical protein